MEDSRFDQLTSELSRRIARRRLALGAGAGLAGLFAAGFPSVIEAGKNKKKKRRKKRRKKKKKQMCTSAYGQKLRCKPNQCCDPNTSTIAACTTRGYPTCCDSSRLAYPAGTVCCDSYPEGIDGACLPDYPVCCPGSIGGGCCLPGTSCCDPADFGGKLYCCTPDRPVCCPNECCAAGDTCAGNVCASSLRGRNAAASGPAPVAGRPPGATAAADGKAFSEATE